jgi:catechol 2,3-dioxygenase-like lactoylglutathione lyase family enzyme
MSKIKFDHCVIKVSDWAVSNRFYAEVLGAEVIPRGEGFMYRFGDFQLNLHGPGLKPTPIATIPVAPGNSHLEHLSVPIELGPVERFGAKGFGTSVYFRDPDGSLLEFISYSSSTTK